jgi:hypothetical protein
MFAGEWITVAARFAGSNFVVVGWNSTRGMDVYVSLFCVCVVLCVGSGLAEGWSPVQGVLPNVYKVTELKCSKGQTKGCRDTVPWDSMLCSVWNRPCCFHCFSDMSALVAWCFGSRVKYHFRSSQYFSLLQRHSHYLKFNEQILKLYLNLYRQSRNGVLDPWGGGKTSSVLPSTQTGFRVHPASCPQSNAVSFSWNIAAGTWSRILFLY